MVIEGGLRFTGACAAAFLAVPLAFGRAGGLVLTPARFSVALGRAGGREARFFFGATFAALGFIRLEPRAAEDFDDLICFLVTAICYCPSVL
jgi:hypothetical protein